MHSAYSFSLTPFPNIEIKESIIDTVADKILLFGPSVLLVTGQSSFTKSEYWSPFIAQLEAKNISWQHTIVADEPSPTLIDTIVKQYHTTPISCIVAIGGGSTLDTAKAISGLLTTGHSVMDYLEGVGKGYTFSGPSIPFIAVPTTAGTGSEATKNAVLSEIGFDGFKKSFRHESLMPKHALIDPLLLSTCPQALIAANGMDALTQLIESYVSSKANAFTDALALSGIKAVRDSLLIWYQAEKNDQSDKIKEARTQMAYAALLSGITLAHVGLGSVHGLASPLGAFYPIPHGVACGTLLATACEINLLALKERTPKNNNLLKYAEIGRLLNNKTDLSQDEAEEALISFLNDWSEKMTINKLSFYGIKEKDLDHIVANSRGNSMLTNPITLTDNEIYQLLYINL